MFSKYLYTLILLFLTFVSISGAFIYFESRFEEAKVACSTPPTINPAATSHQSDIDRKATAERFSCLEELANSEQGRIAIELAEYASWKQLTIPVSEALGALLLLSMLLRWAWRKGLLIQPCESLLLSPGRRLGTLQSRVKDLFKE